MTSYKEHEQRKTITQECGEQNTKYTGYIQIGGTMAWGKICLSLNDAN